MGMKNNEWKSKDAISFFVKFYGCFHKYLQNPK